MRQLQGVRFKVADKRILQQTFIIAVTERSLSKTENLNKTERISLME